MGKQRSLEKLEHFRNQKKGKRRHVLECEQALNGWEKERKLAHFASTQCCSKEQVKSGEAQVESPAGLATHESTACSQKVSSSPC